MDFNEALIAHFTGPDEVEFSRGDVWVSFLDQFGEVTLADAGDDGPHARIKPELFRIKPRTVMCNGAEVPAPESAKPLKGTVFYIPTPHSEFKYARGVWEGKQRDIRYLRLGLVYLNSEACIARAKAMLITA